MHCADVCSVLYHRRIPHKATSIRQMAPSQVMSQMAPSQVMSQTTNVDASRVGLINEASCNTIDGAQLQEKARTRILWREVFDMTHPEWRGDLSEAKLDSCTSIVEPSCVQVSKQARE